MFALPDIAGLCFMCRTSAQQGQQSFWMKRIQRPEKALSGKGGRGQNGYQDEKAAGEKAPEAKAACQHK